MNDLIPFISELGRSSLSWYWLPLAGWSVLAAGTLLFFRMKDTHPLVRQSVLSALLFALPLGAVAAGALEMPSPLPEEMGRRAAAQFTAEAPAPHVQEPAAGEAPAAGLPFWLGALLLAAGLLSVWRLALLGWEARVLARLKRRLRPLTGDPRERAAAVEQELGLQSESVTYLVAAEEDAMPMTFGLLRPVVVLPERLLGEEKKLRLALLHELTHVRRHDYLRRWGERLIDSLFAVNPLVRYVLRAAHRSREAPLPRRRSLVGGIAMLTAGVLLVACSDTGTLSENTPEDASEVEFGTRLEQTVAEANQHHQGDHLIFLYDDSEKSREIVRELFADERVAAYINTHFATLAVRADTPRGNRILNSYAGGGEGPRIVISAQRLNNFIMHKTGGSKKPFLEQLGAIKNASTIDEVRAALQSD